jgi:hypothetical protein
MNPVTPLCPVLALGDEIRADAPRFVEAATRQFQALMTTEYHRLRGYAHESGEPVGHLNVSVTLGFAPGAKSVTIETMPHFVPAPQRAHEVIEPTPAPYIIPLQKGETVPLPKVGGSTPGYGNFR